MLSLAIGVACAAEFAAYEVILIRQPFGTAVADQTASDPAVATPPPEAFVLGYKLTAITRDEEGGVHVGIVDRKSKKSYLLDQCASEDGLFIGDVEIEFGEAQLCKGDEKYWMSLLTGGVASNHAARVAATNKTAIQSSAAIFHSIHLAPPPDAEACFISLRHGKMPAVALTNISYAARKQLRDDLRRRVMEEQRRRTAAAQQLAANETSATALEQATAHTPTLANMTAGEDQSALLTAAGATNRASLVALLEQIGYTNADTVVETEPLE